MGSSSECSLAVLVSPKAGRNEVAGIHVADDGSREVRVRVTAPPEGGKANKAVCETVAKSLGIAKGKVKVARGDTSRHKMLAIDIDPEQLQEWLEAL